MSTKKKTVEKWGFKALEYEFNKEGEVTFICKTCREFYSGQRKHEVVRSSAFTKDQLDKYVTGTSVVKKNNFEHLKKSTAHFNAVKGLSQPTETEATPSPSVKKQL